MTYMTHIHITYIKSRAGKESWTN